MLFVIFLECANEFYHRYNSAIIKHRIFKVTSKTEVFGSSLYRVLHPAVKEFARLLVVEVWNHLVEQVNQLFRAKRREQISRHSLL